MYTRESLEALRDIVDPKDVLSTIGGVPMAEIRESGNEIRCPCPIHGGDRKDGFSWKKNDGVWTCFTHDCGHSGSRDLYGFVTSKLGVPFVEAAKMLAEIYGFQLEKGEVSEYSNWKVASKVFKSYNQLNKVMPETLNSLSGFPNMFEQGWDYVFQYLASRGYPDYEDISDFGIYPCVDSLEMLRMGIPAYDENGSLVGVNARRMDGVLSYPEKATKYQIVSGYKKSNVLYNLQIAKYFCEDRELIIVEGELSSIRLHTYGFKNSVASSGSKLSMQQALLACKYSSRLLFLMEEGEAARKGVLSSIKTLHELVGPGVGIGIATLEAGDADDNSKGAVVQALDNAKYLSKVEVANISKMSYNGT